MSVPTYEYECDACGHRFEIFQKMGSPAQQSCPACKKRRLRRLIGSGAGIIFKGSGFYETDYRSESYKQAAAADRSADAPKEGSAQGESSKESRSKTDSATESRSKAGAATSEAPSKPKKKVGKKPSSGE